ncbi:MAG: ATP-dependent DNA helicase [Lachnospiraceae bacterium]
MFSIVDGVIRISVRGLVEFIFQSGNIDNRLGGISETEAMQAGARIHKKIQKQMGGDYRAEVSMKTEYPMKNYSILVEGRADGIFTEDGMVVVDEIKGMYADVLKMKEPVYVHKAQAMCYAYFYMIGNCDAISLTGLNEHDDDNIRVRLTYVNLETEETKYFTEQFTREEIYKWFEDMMGKFAKWTEFLYESNMQRNESIKNVEFPYAYRDGQRDLVVSVYRTIVRKKVLFIQAPTGVGKTLATVFPAVKAVGEGKGDKIFYLTAKTITRTVAENAFEILREQNLKFRTIILTAKEKMCNHGLNCNPVDCPYARGHYDRINDAVFDIVNNESVINRDRIFSYAEKHMVCPFEYSLDISYWCDGIICDYNYVFDPNAYLRRYFGEGNSGEYLFLIDEAHNLVERGREMYSAFMTKSEVMEFKRFIKIYDNRLYKDAEKLNKEFLEIKRKITDRYIELDSVGSMVLLMMKLYDNIVKFNEENKDTHVEFEFRDELMKFFFKLRDFINISEIADEKYVIYAVLSDDGDVIVKLYCVDPSTNLNYCIEKGNSAVFFSATLLPMIYYKNLLRGTDDDYSVYAKSSFDWNLRKVLIADDVTTRYQSRNAGQYRRVYEYIHLTAKARCGNYMVFFPSYNYMEQVLAYHDENNFETIIQTTDMTEEEKEDFLSSFDEPHRDRPFVGFCVMGGIFSEGIDLREESLIGAVIVGNGLPQVNVERKLLMEWFSKEGHGFEYAYTYPGLNRVLQSAGRVIRTEKDKGVIVLLDSRFLEGGYDGLLPEEWKNMDIVSINTIKSKLYDFWKEK